MEISAVGSISEENYPLSDDEKEISLSVPFEDMARSLESKLRDSYIVSSACWTEMLGFFFVLRSIFSHMERQSFDGTYMKLRKQVDMMSVQWVAFSWDLKKVIVYLRTLAREDHQISLKDLRSILNAILQATYDNIPELGCQHCGDKVLARTRIDLFAVAYFFSTGAFGEKGVRVAEEMIEFLNLQPLTVSKGLTNYTLEFRSYIKQLQTML